MLILVGVQAFSVGLIGEMIVVPRMKQTDNYQISDRTPPTSTERKIDALV